MSSQTLSKTPFALAGSSFAHACGSFLPQVTFIQLPLCISLLTHKKKKKHLELQPDATFTKLDSVINWQDIGISIICNLSLHNLSILFTTKVSVSCLENAPSVVPTKSSRIPKSTQNTHTYMYISNYYIICLSLYILYISNCLSNSQRGFSQKPSIHNHSPINLVSFLPSFLPPSLFLIVSD